jgi:hypothetical protein
MFCDGTMTFDFNSSRRAASSGEAFVLAVFRDQQQWTADQVRKAGQC